VPTSKGKGTGGVGWEGRGGGGEGRGGGGKGRGGEKKGKSGKEGVGRGGGNMRHWLYEGMDAPVQ